MKEMLRRGVERHPLLWAAVVATAAVVWVDGGWWAGVVALALIAGLAWAGKWRALGWCVVVALVVGGRHDGQITGQHELEAWIGEGRSGEVSGVLVGEVKARNTGWVGLLEGQEGRFWFRGFGPVPRRGAAIEAEGRFGPLPEARNPGEFDVRGWLWRQGVAGVFKATSPPRGEGESWLAWGEPVRRAFRETVTRGIDPLSPEAAVIRAVVLGEHPDDDVLIEPFRRSGTLHVFAVSGLHVGMVGLLGWLVLRLAGVPRRVSIPLLMGLMFGYAWLTGMKPPAVRAATMAAVVMGAFLLKRRPDVGNALGLALLWVVAVDSNKVFQVGVQLSFGVVLAIGLLVGWVARGFEWMTWTEPYLPRSLYGRWREGWLQVRRKVAGWFSVSTAAWAGSAPLTVSYFGLVTPVSIVASVVLGVLVFCLLGIAMLSVVVSPLPVGTEGLNRVNGGLARMALGSARFFAEIPGGNWSVARDRPAEDFLIVYDVQSDGAACLHDGGATLLIDVASQRGFERVVLPSLRHLALRPGAMVLTHPDGGHVGGAIEALDAFPIQQGMVPVLRARSPKYRDFLAAAEGRAVRMVRGRAERVYQISDTAQLEVMLEPEPWNWDALADERVMPVRLAWRGWRVLFMADAGWSTEQAILAGSGDLRAEVVVTGRHGYDEGLSEEFLTAVGARVVIAGHDAFPLQQQVPEEWRAGCEARGIRVFQQGECGAVTLVVEDGALSLRGFVDGQEVVLER